MNPNKLSALLVLALCLGLLTSARAVNGDGQPPCWRDQGGTTRQQWRFDSGASPTTAEVANNPSGIPRATITPNANAVGWIDTTCNWLGIGCDPGNGDVDPYGTAQGFWDLGGTNASAPQPGTISLTVSNPVAVTATRYLWIQATVWIESGIAAYPSYVVSNAVQVGSAVNLVAENPTNSDGSFTSGIWYNQQTLWAVPATTTFNTVQLRAAGVGTIVDSVVVDIMVRSAAAVDSVSTPKNTATNLSGATLVSNDGGPTLTVSGVRTPSAAGGSVSLGGATVTYTPPANYTGPDVFYYTNSDCAGGTSIGQVEVAVTGSGPLANTDTVTRTAKLSLHMSKASLLANDTGSGLSFDGLILTSTNGATVTTNATTVFYSNTNDVNDRLTYYIRDGANARAGGYILIQVTPSSSSSVVVRLQTGVPGPNTNTLTLAGIPNYPYIVQFATNAAPETWFNLSTNSAGTNGLWTVLDTTATNSQRYYRITVP